jgi:hypothetical protein
MATFLAEAESAKKAGRSSMLSGGLISLRFFTLSKGTQRRLPEKAEMLLTLADESNRTDETTIPTSLRSFVRSLVRSCVSSEVSFLMTEKDPPYLRDTE